MYGSESASVRKYNDFSPYKLKARRGGLRVICLITLWTVIMTRVTAWIEIVTVEGEGEV